MEPYGYRNLTPEQRAAVVQARCDRGYPLHSPPHPYRGAGCYCITATNYEHAHILANPDRLAAFEDQLLETLTGHGIEVAAWVVLTNHYHVLIDVESLNQVSAALGLAHGRTSHTWNREDGCAGERRVWYRFRDRVIRDERHYYRALNYLHFNPIKHKYVDDPYGWPWSSVHRYFDTLGREWLREKWVAHPIGQAWAFGDEDFSMEVGKG